MSVSGPRDGLGRTLHPEIILNLCAPSKYASTSQLPCRCHLFPQIGGSHKAEVWDEPTLAVRPKMLNHRVGREYARDARSVDRIVVEHVCRSDRLDRNHVRGAIFGE